MAAATAGITRKVRISACSLTIFARRMPLTPAMAPDIAHAQASIRSTGTPSSPLISRLLAKARIARPSLLRLKKTTMPPVMASDSPIAINRV